MEREPSHRDETARRVKKPAKAAPPALPHAVVSDALESGPEKSASCDVVPDAGGRDPALAHVEPKQRSAGSLAKSSATYRVVIQCVVDRRGSDTSR
jgi:hypothetical protein